MATENQINANKQNAIKSTGPKTSEGRAKVAQNAITHGLCAARPVLSTENPEEYSQFRDDFFRRYAPEGVLENSLADRAVNTFWRLQRASTYETLIVDNLLREASNDKTNPNDLMCSSHAGGDGNPDILAAVLLVDFDKTHILERVQGYETRIERSFYRTLKELQKIQTQRINTAEASSAGSSSENSKNKQNKPNVAEVSSLGSSGKCANTQNKAKSNPLALPDLSEMNTLAPDIIKGLMKSSYGLPKMLTKAM
jgi:hypothetical protein